MAQPLLTRPRLTSPRAHTSWRALPLLGALLAAGAAQAQNLVVNGDFAANAVTGWSVAGQLTAVDNLTTGHSGTGVAFFGCFTSATCLGAAHVQQDIATVPGQSYTLSFWLRNNNKPAEVQVHWFDASVASPAPSPAIAPGTCSGSCVYQAAVDASSVGSLPTDGSWVQHTRTVVASASSMRLYFTGYNVPDFIRVDDVSLVSLAPAQPAAPTASAGNAQATVSWVAPSDGGSAITGFTATSVQDASKSCTGGPADTSCTVTGLTNGTAYSFTVVASNANGPSAASPASNAVTPQFDPLLVSAPGTPPVATVGQPYSYTLAVSGGAAPYSWVASGLPAGLAIDPSTGEIAGTPTDGKNASQAKAALAVTVTATDSLGTQAQATLSLTVNAAPITPSGTVSAVPTLAQWALALLAGLAALLGGRQLGLRVRPRKATPYIDTLM